MVSAQEPGRGQVVKRHLVGRQAAGGRSRSVIGEISSIGGGGDEVNAGSVLGRRTTWETSMPLSMHRSTVCKKFYLKDLFGCPVDLVTDKALRPELRPHIEIEACMSDTGAASNGTCEWRIYLEDMITFLCSSTPLPVVTDVRPNDTVSPIANHLSGGPDSFRHQPLSGRSASSVKGSGAFLVFSRAHTEAWRFSIT